MKSPESKSKLVMIWFIRLYALLLIGGGLAMAAGGFRLIQLGGSSYYVLAGLGVILAGGLLMARRREGALLYLAILFVTVVWAIWEAGFDGWRLMPRLLGPVVLGLAFCIPGFLNVLNGRSFLRLPIIVVTALGAVILGAGAYAMREPAPSDPMFQNGTTPPPVKAVVASPRSATDDWPVWGGKDGGTRFSALTQITPDNVRHLKVAWIYRTGSDSTGKMPRLSVTPLKVDRTVYLCTAWNDIIALNAETGKQRWRARSGAEPDPYGSCRGVAFYRVPNSIGACSKRIITGTVDARLIAVDANTGKRCANFGKNGEISLLPGMGNVKKHYYIITSAPVIVRGRIVVGGRLMDNQYWGQPSGVIRAYDAVTGAFSWAFDMGRPDRHTEPTPSESYTLSTPNSWAPMSVDESLGLVFAPTGNATNDYYGAQRRTFDDKYSSSTVAIDAETGRVRWSFQTTHHDLWDYDVSSQPTLADIPTSNGGIRRILVQATKGGDLFVLDRETGQPVHKVIERPAPSSGHAGGERLSPTQPFSVGMPSLSGPDLTERDMWGISPLDQLWCRIAFRKARYEGKHTPPGLKPTIIYPGTAGGSNWGSVSIDTDRHILVANATRMPMWLDLVPRSEADRQGIEVYDAAIKKLPNGSGPQMGTPFAANVRTFLSPLDAPCASPPYGTLSGIDLVTGKLIWTKKFGTAQNSGPFGLPSFLPFTIGTPSLGGSLMTRSGLTFIAATQDGHFRAFETRTGRMLWDTRMPTSAHATPMTYKSPGSGRQFVVIAAGGSANLRSKAGDYVIAYALPK